MPKRNGRQDASPVLVMMSKKKPTEDELDDIETQQMNKNPKDFPFPTFVQSKETAEKKKKKAVKENSQLLNPMRPVVDFHHASIRPNRPLWVSDTSVIREYQPKLDLASRRTPPKPVPPIHPVMRHHIRRVKGGCPQLGVPLQLDESKQESNTKGAYTAREWRTEVATATKLVAKQNNTALMGRWTMLSKQEEINAMLQQPEVLSHIKSEVTHRRRASVHGVSDTLKGGYIAGNVPSVDGKPRFEGAAVATARPPPDAFLVSLPKIGTKLFAMPSYAERTKQEEKNRYNR